MVLGLMHNQTTPRPNFFVVGAPKCGTTSVYEYLSQHPDVFMSENKEPEFFAPNLQWRSDCRVVNEEEYLALFARAGSAKRIGEASTWYLYSTEASRRIKAFAPDAKILVMLRNPVEMCHSRHWHNVRNAEEDLLDFCEALEAEEDRLQGRRIPRDISMPDSLYYRSVPRYTEQLQRYFDLFGRDQVLVIIFDDFVNDTAGEYRRIAEFLEIDTHFTPDFVVANSATTRPVIPLARFWKRHWRIRRWIQIATPLQFRRRAGRMLGKLLRPPPPLSAIDPELRRELQVYFAPEVEKLSRLLDRDLTDWCRTK